MPTPTKPARSVFVVRSTDASGNRIVRVPLAKGRGEAVIDEADFEDLMARGLSPRWTINAGHGDNVGYVRARALKNRRANLVTVARIILEAGRGEHVKYHDEDRTNLRRSNIFIAPGIASRTDAKLLVGHSSEDDWS